MSPNSDQAEAGISEQADGAESREAGPERLEWSVRPCGEKLGRSAGVLVLILSIGFLVLLLFRDVFLGIMSVLILFASLHTYFGRTTYRLDLEQVAVRSSFGTTAKRWSHFKRFYVDRKGVTLSPFAKPSRLEPFRSLRLLYGGNKDEVVAFVSKRLGGDAGGGTR